jgi:hypothetical protein
MCGKEHVLRKQRFQDYLSKRCNTPGQSCIIRPVFEWGQGLNCRRGVRGDDGVAIVSDNRKEDRGFESRQGARFLGLNIAMLFFIMFLCVFELN